MDERVAKLKTTEECENFARNARERGRADLADEALRRSVELRGPVLLGYTALLEMGLHDYAFEAVILRYPKLFSDEAVKRSKERVKNWRNA